MAVMSDTDRARCTAQYMRGIKEGYGITKDDLRAAINALDDFLNTNATAINNAFPTAAKNNMTASQKASVVAYVAFRRAGLLHAEEDG